MKQKKKGKENKKEKDSKKKIKEKKTSSVSGDAAARKAQEMAEIESPAAQPKSPKPLTAEGITQDGAGIKWTKQRKRVYQILDEAAQPMSAAGIYAHLEAWEQEKYALSTIYRILSAFEENGIVEKTTWMGEGTAVYGLKRPGHVHYAVCLSCHKRIPLEHCPLHMSGAHHTHSAEESPLEKETDGFTVVSHKIELYGYCKDCKQNT